jgi:hypothetical protein
VDGIAAFTKRIENEIRLKYEYGESLEKLALDYAIPISTLKKRSSKSRKNGDAWVKGKYAEVGYNVFLEENEKAKSELRKVLMKEGRTKFIHLNNIFKTRAKKENEDMVKNSKAPTLSMAGEIAFSTKVNTTVALIKGQMEFEGLYGDEKQMKINKTIMEIKLAQLDIKIKESEAGKIDTEEEKSKQIEGNQGDFVDALLSEGDPFETPEVE